MQKPINTLFLALILGLSLALPSAASAAPDNPSSNASTLFQASSAALKKHDVSTAGIAFFMAEIRAEADFHCFPPAEDAYDNGIKQLRDQNAITGEELKGVLEKDPKTFADVVEAVDAWIPMAAAGYDPGWHFKSQCQDYAKAAADSKEFNLHPVRDLSRLLNYPEYFKAYGVYTDVYQEYDTPPPSGAYSAERLKAAAEAKNTLQAIERSTGLIAMSPALAYAPEQTLPFKVIKTGTTGTLIQFPQQVPGGTIISGTGIVAVAGDAKAFDALWKSLIPAGNSSGQAPTIDFSSHLVVFVSGGKQLAATAPMFINRIDLEHSSMTVLIRVPASTQACNLNHDVYPFVIAVIDKPTKAPLTAGYDSQNFPINRC